MVITKLFSIGEPPGRRHLPRRSKRHETAAVHRCRARRWRSKARCGPQAIPRCEPRAARGEASEETFRFSHSGSGDKSARALIDCIKSEEVASHTASFSPTPRRGRSSSKNLSERGRRDLASGVSICHRATRARHPAALCSSFAISATAVLMTLAAHFPFDQGESERRLPLIETSRALRRGLQPPAEQPVRALLAQLLRGAHFVGPTLLR